jgi:hypothetical protein
VEQRRVYDFPVETKKPEEEPRPNFNVPKLVDEAITNGRIAYGERDKWLRAFEEEPYSARRRLAESKPDVLEASRNYFADPAREGAYSAYFRAAFGEEPLV